MGYLKFSLFFLLILSTLSIADEDPNFPDPGLLNDEASLYYFCAQRPYYATSRTQFTLIVTNAGFKMGSSSVWYADVTDTDLGPCEKQAENLPATISAPTKIHFCERNTRQWGYVTFLAFPKSPPSYLGSSSAKWKTLEECLAAANKKN